MVCIQIIIHNTMSRNPSGMTIDRLIIFFLTNRNVRKTESSAFLTIPALFTKDIGLNIFLLSRLYVVCLKSGLVYRNPRQGFRPV